MLKKTDLMHMKSLKGVLALMLVALAVSAVAQTPEKKASARIRVEEKRGKEYLVLSTGRHTSDPNIEILLEDNTWRMLDSLLAAPRSASVQVKDLKGNRVDIALADVNAQRGLMFSSGIKAVAVTGKEYEALKKELEVESWQKQR